MLIEIAEGEKRSSKGSKRFLHPQVDGFIRFDERSVETEDDPLDVFSQTVKDLSEIIIEIAGDILIDAVTVKGSLGKDEVCLLGGTAVGETIAYKNDEIVVLSVELNQVLLAGSAAAAVLVGVRESDGHPLPFKKLTLIRIIRDFGKMMNTEDPADIEVKPITDDFDFYVCLAAGVIKRQKERINAGMLINEPVQA